MHILAESFQWPDIFNTGLVFSLIRAAIVLVVGVPVLITLSATVGRFTKERLSKHGRMLIRKIVFYGGSAVIVVTILHQFGFQLTAILGAAGIAGIAIGFAAQTSFSNVISGLFLLSEKPFEVGDAITVEGKTGTVLSVDLLSVKIKTFDNRFIRIPNETLIKEELTNASRFDTRRIDIDLGVDYSSNLGKVKEILLDIAANEKLILDDPEPAVGFTDFGESAIGIFYGVWTQRTDYIAAKNAVIEGIRNRFDAEGIVMPYPQRTIALSPSSPPMQVKMAS